MERWRIIVELTYDTQDGDADHGAGPGPELDRAKESLQTLLNGSPFQHYHILQLPHRCFEFD